MNDGWIWVLIVIVAILVIGVIVWSVTAKSRASGGGRATGPQDNSSAGAINGVPPVGGATGAGLDAAEGTVSGFGAAAVGAGAAAAGLGAAAVSGNAAANGREENASGALESENTGAEEELEPQAVPTRIDDSAGEAQAGEETVMESAVVEEDAPGGGGASSAVTEAETDEPTPSETPSIPGDELPVQGGTSAFAVDGSGSVDPQGYSEASGEAVYTGEGAAASVTLEEDSASESIPLPPSEGNDFTEPALAEPTLDVPEGTMEEPALDESVETATSESTVFVSGIDGNVESVEQVLGETSTPSVDELIAEAESKDSTVRETLANSDLPGTPGEAPADDADKGDGAEDTPR